MPTADLDAACAGCDVVFHAAAHFAYGGVSPAVLHDTAVAGTERSAACLRSCRALARGCHIVIRGVRLQPRWQRASMRRAGLANGDGEAPYVAAKIAQHRRALELGEQLEAGCAAGVPDDDDWSDGVRAWDPAMA